MERWVGKVAIVTGASSGIGEAIVERLVRDGLQVVGLARRLELLEANAKKLSNYKGKLHPFKTDITKEEEILAAFKWATENVGPVHILVNNAGILTDTNLIDGDTAKWRALFDTNLMGLLIASREAVRVMRKHGIDGHVVHISSIAGHYPMYLPTLNVYGASKYAITNVTEVLRRELVANKSKIRVTSISPGLVKTDIANVMKTDDEILDAITNGPGLLPEDIADAVAYVVATPQRVQIHEMIIRPNADTFS